MNKRIHKKILKLKGDVEMSMLVEKLALKKIPKNININPKKIYATSERLEVKRGRVQLNPNNPEHRDWYENDEDYDI
ncbi:hypothetical protein P9265_14855 [Schinkia azotoformans]|uniref:hypothetical protein n=1 Tax=Schinkia azotoformans TaxID=1454 RepID=UPI002E20CE7F|nr:hypothetical protein [Schinkia azotoformans]